MNASTSNLKFDYLASDLFSHFLDGIGDVMFFLKDTDSRIINCNLPMAENCGFASVDELRGKTDFDVFPHELAVHYRADDAEVFSSQKAKQNIIELFPNHMSHLQWIVCNKTPVIDSSGGVRGLLGTCQPYENSKLYSQSFEDIAQSLEYIKLHYAQPISNEQLAALSNLSVRQFEKRFKQIFDSTVHQYILELRVLKACELLVKRTMAMPDIASSLGFYDQSAFIAAFKRRIGITPLKYIKKHTTHSSKAGCI